MRVLFQVHGADTAGVAYQYAIGPGEGNLRGLEKFIESQVMTAAVREHVTKAAAAHYLGMSAGGFRARWKRLGLGRVK